MLNRPSDKQELNIAKQLRSIFGVGKRQPGSGNQATSPNDVAVRGELHVECKQTERSRIYLELDWMLRAARKAMPFGVPAVVAVQFPRFSKHDYFIVRDDEFYQLLRLKQEHEQCLISSTA